MKNINNKNSFTLVETLIAISVMMIAVVGPMTIANNALTAALSARNTMIATYLAQDGMESIKNIKDANIIFSNETTRGSIFDFLNNNSNNSNNCLIDNSKKCKIPEPDSSIIEGSSRAGIPCPTVGCIVYINDGSGVAYTYNNGVNRKSPFKRYYNVELVSNSTNEIFVNVYVDWQDLGVDNEIHIRELMSDNIH